MNDPAYDWPPELLEIHRQLRQLNGATPYQPTPLPKSPDLCVTDEGATSFTGALSPGCACCRQGTWLCLFVTMRCNLDCPFCLRSTAHTDPEGKTLLDLLDLSKLDRDLRDPLTQGVSFTGGEPLLIAGKVTEIIARCRRIRPDIWLWLYTNGLLARPEIGQQLHEAGLNELRFNLAATGYLHPRVMENITHAADLFNDLTVEIPAIPADLSVVLEALPLWAERGITRLNLHELVYDAGSASASMPGCRTQVHMRDGHACEYNPDSRNAVIAIIEEIQRKDLPISVNYCSLASKELQMQGRRARVASQTLLKGETRYGPDMAERYCLFDSHQVLEYFGASELESRMNKRTSGQAVARLRRLLPLSESLPGTWISLDVVHGEINAG